MANALSDALPASIAARRAAERGDAPQVLPALPGDPGESPFSTEERLRKALKRARLLETWLRDIGREIEVFCEECAGTGVELTQLVPYLEDQSPGDPAEWEWEAAKARFEADDAPTPCKSACCFEGYSLAAPAPQGLK